MKLVARIGSVAVIGLLAVLLVGGYASAGKSKTAKVNDERSNGKFYDKGIYAKCDIDKLSVTSKRGKLIVKANFRGRHEEFNSPLGIIYINTKGGKKSNPEFTGSGYTGESIYTYKSYKDTGSDVKAKRTKKGKAESVEMPLKAFGRGVDKLGVQIQTCGEGAVDIAPGKDYFDKDYGDTIKFQFLNVKV